MPVLSPQLISQLNATCIERRPYVLHPLIINSVFTLGVKCADLSLKLYSPPSKSFLYSNLLIFIVSNFSCVYIIWSNNLHTISMLEELRNYYIRMLTRQFYCSLLSCEHEITKVY